MDKAGRVQAGRGLTGRAVARRVELRSEQAEARAFLAARAETDVATQALATRAWTWQP